MNVDGDSDDADFVNLPHFRSQASVPPPPQD